MTIIKTVATRRLGAAALCAWSLGIAPSARAAYDVTIVASGSSSGGAWSGDTWTASASGATLLASEIETHLGSGPTHVETGSTGTEHGDITVNGAVAWSANTLTLNAARDIDIEAALAGTGTAALSLAYGQHTAAAGNQALYRIGVPVTLPSNPTDPTGTANFTLTRGYDGIPAPRAVPACPKITRTGWIFPGCSFLNQAALGAMTISYKTAEVNVAPDTPTFIYLPIKSPNPATVTFYPFAMGVQDLDVGKFYFPSSQSQTNYFDADGNILPGTVNSSGVIVDDINTTTRSNDINMTWRLGPIHTFYDTRYFDHGYYIKFQPGAGELGRDYQALSMLIADETGIGYSVIDYVIHVLPPVPTVGVAGNLSLATATPGSADLTLAGTGALVLSATSSNSALLPDANIGAASCTAAGHCALTVTPVAGASGDATVTLTVMDAYYRSATTSFTVSVAPSSASGSSGGNSSGGGGSSSGATTTENFVGGGALSLEGFGLLLLFFRRRQPR